MKSKKPTQTGKRKRFGGDATHRLPAGMKEHYRLWFEFLKLAHRDPNLKDKIDRRFYADWGEVASADFDKWWELHWRKLFGVPLSVVRVGDETALAALDRDRLLLSIDPAAGIEETLDQVKAILKERTAAKPRKKLGLREQGRFSLTGITELKRLNMQQALKVYELQLTNSDLDDIVRRYLKWADAWNEKVEVRGWRRSRINAPSFFGPYAADRAKGERRIDDQRRPIRRLVQRAKKIASNVANGEFPGAK